MNIPNYLPIGFFKGYSKENEEWVYGWHWTKTPYSPIVEKDSKIEHYIRVQHNHDWNLTSQEDYLVEPESVAQYIGKKDIDGTPLFLGDTVSFYFMKECHFGQIQFDTRILSYIVNWDGLNRTEIYNVDDIKFVGDKYRPNKEDKATVHTVALFFEKDKDNLTLEDILSGVAYYKEFFGDYPKEMHLTETQHKSFIENTKELYSDIIEVINEKYGCKVIVEGKGDN